MPTIHLTPLRDDHFEVIVIKDVPDQAASGRLLVFELGDDTRDDGAAIARLSGSWSSPSSEVAIGTGTLDREAAGKQVVATQRSASGPDTRSAPKKLPGLPS
ncbi:MAG: hypothetical protein H6712_04970 [Myxococcales bacterium]|nr:hypothetical protein [Myxococcales bacterium]MCB9713183.1 hypothetical protein [Myxococcales bacterium]